MHQPYRERLKRMPDFRVAYHFLKPEEGGRRHLPYQGLRCDFWYSHPVHNHRNQVFMIWPEFLNDDGEIILEDAIPVRPSGFADMWIINGEWIQYHRDKISLGMVGYFMEGRKTATCTVVDIFNSQFISQKL